MKRRSFRKVLKVTSIFVLAVILTLGLVISGVTASAQTPTPPELHDGMLEDSVTFGHVIEKSEDGNSFTMQADGQDEVTVNVDEDTSYIIVVIPPESTKVLVDILEEFLSEGFLMSMQRLPETFTGEGTLFQIASFEDLVAGDMVLVEFDDSEGIASDVIIVRPADMHRVRGNITEVNDSSITITPEGGDPLTLTWNEDTLFWLRGVIAVESGQIASIIYNTNSNQALFVVIKAVEAMPSPSTPISS